MKNSICIIPLRSNSKRLKNKNIKKINNIPLCIYSINQAIKSKIFNRIIIASDSIKYFNVIKRYLSKEKKNKQKNIYYYLRSKNSAKSNSQTEIVLKEILDKEILHKETNCKYVFMIQATSPLIIAKDILNCKKSLLKNNFDSVFTSYKDDKFVWINEKKLKPINYNVNKRPMKQKFINNIFNENGAIYAFKLKGFLKANNRLFSKIGTIVMPKNRSIDIDTETDFLELKKLLKTIKE